MKITSLQLHLNSWAQPDGHYYGFVSFDSNGLTGSLNLTEQVADEVFRVVAHQLLQFVDSGGVKIQDQSVYLPPSVQLTGGDVQDA